MHKDELVSYRTLMRANQLELDREDTWLLGSLIALPIKDRDDTEALVQKVMDLCQAHSQLKKIKRISLVKRLGASNRLLLLSSATAAGVVDNMYPGYTCFVNQNGSLSAMRPGNIRFFAEARSVVDWFKTQGLPPQRSIARIAQMNLGAGLCSGVFADNRLTGYIFMNGQFTQADLDQNNISYLLQAIFAAVRPVYENSWVSPLYWKLYEKSPDDYIGRRLEIGNLKKSIQETFLSLSGRVLDLRVGQSSLSAEALISHGNVGQILGRALAAIEPEKLAVVSAHEDGSDMLLVVKVDAEEALIRNLESHQALRLDEVGIEARRLGLKLEVLGTRELHLRVMLDRAAIDKRISYSVESAGFGG